MSACVLMSTQLNLKYSMDDAEQLDISSRPIAVNVLYKCMYRCGFYVCVCMRVKHDVQCSVSHSAGESDFCDVYTIIPGCICFILMLPMLVLMGVLIRNENGWLENLMHLLYDMQVSLFFFSNRREQTNERNSSRPSRDY